MSPNNDSKKSATSGSKPQSRTRVFTAPDSAKPAVTTKSTSATPEKQTRTPSRPATFGRFQRSGGRPSHSQGNRSGSGQRAPGRQMNRSPFGRQQSNRPGRIEEVIRTGSAKEEATQEASIPPLADGVVRIVPLGGAGEVNRNMYVIEYGNDIVVIDAGLMFAGEELPGIEYTLPNVKYLEDRKDRVRALLVTHGHLDHIGAIPYVMDKIGNPPIYSRLLTTVMIKKRQEEFPHLPELDIRVIETEQRISFESLSVRFFSVSHSIPDSMGIIIETPYGDIVHTGDIRVDNDDGVATEAEEKEFSRFKKDKVLLLLTDSTNAEVPGFSISERLVIENVEEIIKNVPGRLIIGTFASQLERIMNMIRVCEKLGKKVIIDGRSMKSGVEIVRYLKMLVTKDDTIIPLEEMENYPPDRIVIIATGAQGDEYASLMRTANKTHKYIKLTKRDTIMLSSSIIPGNEKAVQLLKDNLARQGVKIIHYRSHDIHASGHAKADELLWVHQRVGEKFFLPIHGSPYMQYVHAEIAKRAGVLEQNIIVPEDGMLIEIQEKGEKMVVLKERAPSNPIIVDGFTVGETQEVVIRDRHLLSQDGMFVIIASINPKTGKLRKSPDIISRGFVYLRESQDLLNQARIIIKKNIEDTTKNMHQLDLEYTKNVLAENVSRFLFQKTNKRPLVIPVIIGL